jgi:Uma2 family endonuclease
VDEGKAEIYAEAGIPEYWLVRAEERVVDVFREPTREGYRSKVTLSVRDTLRSSAIESVGLLVVDIFPTSI